MNSIAGTPFGFRNSGASFCFKISVQFTTRQ